MSETVCVPIPKDVVRAPVMYCPLAESNFITPSAITPSI